MINIQEGWATLKSIDATFPHPTYRDKSFKDALIKLE